MKKMIALLPLLGLAACTSPQPTKYQYSQYQCGEELLAITYDAQADMVQFPYAGVYHKLGRVESDNGAKYSDGVTTTGTPAARAARQPLGASSTATV